MEDTLKVYSHEYIYYDWGRCSLINGRWYFGCTTILANGMPTSKGLIKWIASIGFEMSEKIKTDSGNNGTLVHNKIEEISNELLLIDQEKLWDLYDSGQKNIIQDVLQELYKKVIPLTNLNLEMMVFGWMKFVEENRVFFIQNELQLFSNKYRVSGTTDALCFFQFKTPQQRLVILDYKTSNHLHDTMDMQLSMYKYCLIEHGKISPNIEDTDMVLLNLLKGDIAYKLHTCEYCFDTFLHALECAKWWLRREYKFNFDIANKGW